MTTDSERKRHRQVCELDLTRVPAQATHVATLPNGVKYFVQFDDEGMIWIQPSDQYGEGYAFSSLYRWGATFTDLKGHHE